MKYQKEESFDEYIKKFCTPKKEKEKKDESYSGERYFSRDRPEQEGPENELDL